MEVDCPQFESVVPITITRPGKAPEACGSGIMLQLANYEVLFTAAHVLDLANEGQLCHPQGERFVAVRGYIWKNPLLGHDRENDPVDIGYAAFPSLIQSPVTFRHLEVDDIEPDLPNGDGFNGYTFVGYPVGKTKRRRAGIDTALQRYSGNALSNAELIKHGLNPKLHLAIRFRLRKARHGDSNLRKMAPHPRGMSGGGIFAWPKGARDLKSLPDRFPLVGIFHTFDAERSLMVGTRVEYALAALRQGLAHLRKTETPKV